MKLFENQKGNKEVGKFLEGHIFQWKYTSLSEQGIWGYLFNRILKCYGTMTAMSHFLPFQMRMIIKWTILLFHPCMFGGCETDILSFWSLNLWIERSHIRTWCRTQGTEFWSSGYNWISLWGYVRRWRNFAGGRIWMTMAEDRDYCILVIKCPHFFTLPSLQALCNAILQ